MPILLITFSAIGPLSSAAEASQSYGKRPRSEDQGELIEMTCYKKQKITKRPYFLPRILKTLLEESSSLYRQSLLDDLSTKYFELQQDFLI